MGNPSRILIVDNDADVASVLTDCLGLRGAVVARAIDGEDGLAKIQASILGTPRDAFDVVLLDLRMPRLGGRALLERLHAWLPDDAAVPCFVVLSGFIDDVDRAALDADPMVDCLLKKPFDFVELLATIDRLTERRREAPRHEAPRNDAPRTVDRREAGA